jgi:sigma-B regulation protein RsbU (phosphoserine phosphatase)
MEEEIKRARDIQRALFPEKVPKIPNYEISTFKQYSMELGGDLFDLRRIDDKRLSIAIGDASGKGISGAILVSTLYAAFRTGRKKYLEVNEIIERLNNSVANLTKPGSYYTFFYGILNYYKGIFTYTNAGHNPPYLIRNSGKFEQLDVGGIVLGFFKGIKYKMSEIKIETGDILVFYTDGITECKDDKDEEFGEKRFLDILLKNNSLSPKKLQEEIINSLISFTQRSVFSDDITLVIIKKISKENNYE